MCRYCERYLDLDFFDSGFKAHICEEEFELLVRVCDNKILTDPITEDEICDLFRISYEDDLYNDKEVK